MENVGQADENVRFYTFPKGKVAVLSDGSVLLDKTLLSFGSSPRFVLGKSCDGGKINFFAPKETFKGIRLCSQVVLKEIYPNIDAVLTLSSGDMTLQFFVRPGGEVSDINLRAENGSFHTANGEIVLTSPSGEDLLKMTGLRAFQGTQEITVNAEVEGSSLRFAVGEYDRRHTLVIDPYILSAAVIGGYGEDVVKGVAYASDGTIYITGSVGAYDGFIPLPVHGTLGSEMGSDAFVLHFAPDGITLIEGAIVSGSYIDEGVEVFVASEIYVVGFTFSTDIAPSRVVFGQASSSSIFVTRLSPDLSTHLGTALIGGAADEYGKDIIVSPSGDVFVLSLIRDTAGLPSPLTVYGAVRQGDRNVMVSKLTYDLNTYIKGVVLASDSADHPSSMALSTSSGNLYVSGTVGNASTFASHTVMGTAGGQEVFVSLFSSSLNHIRTVLVAGSSEDIAAGVDLGADDTVYVAGYTMSSNIAPSRTTLGTRSGWDVFATKLSPDLTNHVKTTVVSGSGNEYAYAMDVSAMGYVYITGRTTQYSGLYGYSSTAVFGTTGEEDVFFYILNGDLNHSQTSVLAGSKNDMPHDIEVSPTLEDVAVVGRCVNSSDFAPSRATFGTTGGEDGFFTMFNVEITAHVGTSVFGSLGYDGALGVAASPSGEVYITGETYTPVFAPSRIYHGPSSWGKEAFVSLFSPDLATHIVTAILSGGGSDGGTDILFEDMTGTVIVGGHTASYDFLGGAYVRYGSGGYTDAFVALLSPDLATLMGAAVVGGRGYDYLWDIDLDPTTGNVALAGETWDTLGLPAPLYIYNAGGIDAFVGLLDFGLNYLGTAVIGSSTEGDYAYGVAFDLNTGDVVIAGKTHNSFDFGPPGSAMMWGNPDGEDAFLVAFAPDLSALFQNFVIGGSSSDGANALAYDPLNGLFFLVGRTGSPDMPFTLAPLGPLGSGDGFVAVSDLSSFVDGVYVGGSGWDELTDVYLSGDTLYIAGKTANPFDFPGVVSVYGTTGDMDALVMEMDLGLTSANTYILASSKADEATSVFMNYPSSVKTVYTAGVTCEYTDFLSGGYTPYPTLGGCDAFAAVLYDVATQVSERPSSASDFTLEKDGITINLKRQAYVGVDVYDASGRLVHRQSVGILPAGEHRVGLKLKRGAYTLKVRIGDRVKLIKAVR